LNLLYFPRSVPAARRTGIEAADTGGSVAMFEFTVPVGAKVPPPHYHRKTFLVSLALAESYGMG